MLNIPFFFFPYNLSIKDEIYYFKKCLYESLLGKKRKRKRKRKVKHFHTLMVFSRRKKTYYRIF
jgi:hypothetical protein